MKLSEDLKGVLAHVVSIQPVINWTAIISYRRPSDNNSDCLDTLHYESPTSLCERSDIDNMLAGAWA